MIYQKDTGGCLGGFQLILIFRVPHPMCLTETLGQPNAARHLSSQLMFELYGVPSLAYGLDCLHSLRTNQGPESTALVVSLGHQTVHIVPVIRGEARLEHARRLNLGAAQVQHHLQRWLQLKYPSHVASLTLSRAEEVVARHTRVSPHFRAELNKWRDGDYYDNHVLKIQLPFTVQPKAPPPDPEVLRARRQELARRLVEINARKRDEKMVADEATLKQLLAAKEFHQQGYETKFVKTFSRLNLGITDTVQLEAMIEKVKARIEKAKESKAKGEVKEEKLVEPEVKRRREDMEEREREEFDLWLEDVRNKYEHLKEKKAARQLRRQQLAKRRTAASQERMRIISQLARNTKKEDTFGMKDEDWDVYKQISKEGGDSDSEEEGLRAAEYEAVLKEHEPQEEEVGKDSPEWHQVHLATEIIRAPELLFQPSMIGSDQAGLSEIMQFVLGKFSDADADEMANNVFLTGGLANLPGLRERLMVDLMEMRPFGSTQKVVLAVNPSTDGWSGASAWAATSSGPASPGWVSKQDWEERGEGHLAEHLASNKYFPTPPPRQEVKGEEDDDA